MSGEDDDSEKSHEPSQKKLEDARKKGEIPRSADLTTASAYAGFLIAALAVGNASFSAIGTVLANLLDKADTHSHIWFNGSGVPLSGGVIGTLAVPVLVWFGLPAIAAILAILGQRSFVFALDKLQPKLSRVSIVSNAKNKFGRSGLFEFAKSVTKLGTYCIVLGLILFVRFPDIVATIQMQPENVISILAKLSIEFLAIVLVVALIIGVIDYTWQYNEHIRKNKMSHKEMIDEHKQMEGDPHVKQQRRQRGFEIAMNQMLKDVPDADVIIVNPQHYAVALKWSRAVGEAPVCIAKGVDEIASRIREAASEAGVPIHSDPPTARALYAKVNIGEQIRPDHYRAVAAAIRFAEAMRTKVKGYRN